MNDILLLRRGGSTNLNSELNFKIVGSTTQPTSPSENTIWVDTSTSITSWAFSDARPNSPTAGMVWFQTGLSSNAPFNAIKNNYLEMLPVGCKQYVDGTWVSATAKTYQNGSWVDWWQGELYANGNQYTDVTGGWAANDVSSVEDNYTTPVLTFNADSLDICIPDSNEGGTVHPVNKIDLTEYSSITMMFSWVNGSAHVYDALYVCEDFINPYRENYVAKVDSWGSNTTVTLDVSSLKGSYYIGIGIYGVGSNKTMRLNRLQMTR